MDNQGYLYLTMVTSGYTRISMLSHGFPWLAMDSLGLPWISLGPGAQIIVNFFFVEILELIPGISGFPGNGVKSRKPDPHKHAQESSDDVSFQETPSN